MKSVLTSPPLLKYPDWNHPFILRTDASIEGLGAVLCQDFGDRAGPNVIAYASRSLKPSEKNYSVYKLEFLALYWAITQKFKHYLQGRKFTVTSDHNPLTYILTSAKLDAASHRWLAELSSSYEFNILYKPGKANVDADALSRMPERELSVEEVKAAANGHLMNDYSGFLCQVTAQCQPIEVDSQEPKINWGDEQDKDAELREIKKFVLKRILIGRHPLGNYGETGKS